MMQQFSSEALLNNIFYTNKLLNRVFIISTTAASGINPNTGYPGEAQIDYST